MATVQIDARIDARLKQTLDEFCRSRGIVARDCDGSLHPGGDPRPPGGIRGYRGPQGDSPRTDAPPRQCAGRAEARWRTEGSKSAARPRSNCESSPPRTGAGSCMRWWDWGMIAPTWLARAEWLHRRIPHSRRRVPRPVQCGGSPVDRDHPQDWASKGRVRVSRLPVRIATEVASALDRPRPEEVAP